MVSVKFGAARAAAQPAATLRSQRGAAVFIVVLMMTLLTALGIFAVRSASLADVAAGYDREGVQASLVAQYGLTATTAFIGAKNLSTTVVQTMSLPLPFKQPKCETNPGLPGPPCYQIRQAQDIQADVMTTSNEFLFAPSNTSVPVPNGTSSLNVNETTDAAFAVELTEVAPTGVPLSGDNTLRQYQVTVTSMAQVRSVGACPGGVGVTPPNAADTAVRSIITVGALLGKQ